MNIQEIAKDLRKMAEDFPLDPLSQVEIDDKLAREFVFKGYPVRVIFTFTKLLDRKAWILSMRDKTGNQLPEDIVEEIKNIFLSGNIIELPDILHAPKVVRKFMQLG